MRRPPARPDADYARRQAREPLPAVRNALHKLFGGVDREVYPRKALIAVLEAIWEAKLCVCSFSRPKCCLTSLK